MIKRLARAYAKFLATLSVAIAVGVAFFAPIESLTRGGGPRNFGGGELFGSVVALLGEGAARYLLSALFVVFAFLFWRLSKRPANGGRNAS